MRWPGHVACIGMKRILKGLSWRKLKGKKHLKDVGVDTGMTLKIDLVTL
jgi:hypothetical protein